ncbi:MAG: prefoldin subunit beta [Candidatus Nitrosocaldaceae archaeon]
MSEQELPPWLKEQIARFNQLQQNLQAILIQKQQIEIEVAETDKALEELRKVGESEGIYKTAGAILIKSKKDDVIKELEEKKELNNTRIAVLSKQEIRIRESLKEAQAKLDEMLKGLSGKMQPRAE